MADLKRSWLHDSWIAVVTVIIGLALAWLSSQLPFEEILKRGLVRFFMPAMSLGYPDQGQNAITVITIDDQDLLAFDYDWPLPLDFIARRLAVILKAHPKAVFLDLLFMQKQSPDQIDALSKVICGAGATQIFIATRGAPEKYSSVEKALFGFAAIRGSASGEGQVTDRPCAIPVRVEGNPDQFDQLRWTYPMQVLPAFEEGISSVEMSSLHRSAAFEIFCNQYPRRCPKSPAQSMAMIWPASSFHTNVQTMIAAVPEGSGLNTAESPGNSTLKQFEGVCRDGVRALEAIPGVRVAMNLFDPKGRKQRELAACPYHQVIPLRAFNRIGFSDGEIQSALANKIVMIGANLVGASDRINSPLHGSLPGVHVHAMALDNLISFDGAYKQHADFDPENLGSSGSKFVIVSIIVIVFVLTLWRRLFPDVNGERSVRVRPIVDRLVMFALAPLLILLGVPKRRTADWRTVFHRSLAFVVLNLALSAAIFAIGYLVFRQGPLSMVEYVLFPFLAHFLQLGEAVSSRCIEWWAALRSSDPWGTWYARSGER